MKIKTLLRWKENNQKTLSGEQFAMHCFMNKRFIAVDDLVNILIIDHYYNI